MKYIILDRVQLLVGIGLYIYLFYLSSLEARTYWESPILGAILWTAVYITWIKYMEGKSISHILEKVKGYFPLILVATILAIAAFAGVFHLIYVLCSITAQAIMTLPWTLSWITLPIAILCFAYWILIGYVFIKAFSPKEVSNE